MKITLKVEQQDGQAYEVTTNLFSIVALERKFHPYYPVIVVRSKTAAPAKAAVP